jgi:peptide/nickel transport system substrate-binding protein
MAAASRPTRRWHRRLAVLSIGGLLVAACGGGDDDTAEPDDVTTQDDSGDTGDEPATDDGSDDGSDGDGDEPATDDGGSEPATEVDDDTSDGSPVVVTLPPEEDSDPVPGGTLRYGLEADVDGINPTASALSAPGLMMSNAVFDTLAATRPDGSWVPFLAESFTPNDDFSVWTMKLREGVTFHDGEPLNSAAILVNFESQSANPLVGVAVTPFFPETDGVTVVDDLTVQYNLLDSDAFFPVKVASQLGMIASPAWLGAALADPTLNQEPVGTGPFAFDSRSQDSVTRFVRNDSWWNGEVYLDAVEFYPVTDSDNRVDLLFGGELDALQTTSPASVLDLQADANVQNVISDAGEESFAMINSTVPPFDDIRAREALAWATPRQNYIDLIGLGSSRGADQAFIPESPYYNPDVKQQADDPARAVELAAEYCAERGTDINTVLAGPTCTDGKINIQLQWSGPSVEQERIAELLTEGWSAAFNVTRDDLFQQAHIQETAFGQYNVVTWRQFGAEDPSADNVWLLCRTIKVPPLGISLNWPQFCDEERDALLLDAQATTDAAERVALYQQVVEKINQDFLYIFFIHTTWANSYAEDVRGICDRTSPEGEPLACTTNGRAWFSTVWFG